VEIAMFEVGLGGPLKMRRHFDARSWCDHEVDFDHENFLGHSLEEIARKKQDYPKRMCPGGTGRTESGSGKSDFESTAELNALP